VFFSTHRSLTYPVITLHWRSLWMLLFEVKFTMLFIASLILFLILVPFNITRHIRIINYFKLLLDSYQGPYKIKILYMLLTWFAASNESCFLCTVSALNTSTNLMISVILLEGMLWMSLPFKTIQSNTVKFLSLLNLHTLQARGGHRGTHLDLGHKWSRYPNRAVSQ